LKLLQRAVDGDGLRVVKAEPIALEGIDALRRREQRLQV
jgi:endonuclease YncB( thermonuclease family)